MSQLTQQLKRSRDVTVDRFSKKFRQNNLDNGSTSASILQHLENDPTLATKSSSTLLRQMQAAAKYEGWYHSRLEEEEEEEEDGGPYSQEAFTLQNLSLYIIERAQCSVGIDGGVMKVQSVYVDLKHLISEAKEHNTVVPKKFTADLYARCQGLAKLGLLSTEGKPKLVVDVADVKLVVASLLKIKTRKAYNLQLALMVLLVLYSGVRLSSLVPKEKALEKEWKLLRWENITLYRQGRDSDGDAITVRINFQHVKCKDVVLNKADHTFTRTFTSVPDKDLDVGSLIVALLVAQNYLSEDVEAWYASGRMALMIKEEAMKKPVFCRNDVGGHAGVLSDEPWNTQYASHAIKKAFEKANIQHITSYSLRRFFIQKAQTLVDSSKVASLAGHHPNSVVQYTKYGNTFSTLDIVKMIQESKFEDMEQANKYIEGVRCTQQLFRRMSKDEYKKEVAPFIEQEKKELDAVVATLKESYGDKFKDSVASWSAIHIQLYKKAYRAYKNAQDRYRRKGLKKLAEDRRKKALAEMVVDENGSVIADVDDQDEVSIEVMDLQSGEEDSSAPISATRTADDCRIKRIRELSNTNPTTLVGLHDCQLCVEDDTITEKRKPIYGHKAHLMHLFQGFVAPGWPGNKSNRRGQHSESAIFARQNPINHQESRSVCVVCNRSFSGKNHKQSSKRHLNQHADKEVEDLNVDDAKEVIANYFLENFGVEWDRSELDKILEERKTVEQK